MYVGEWIRRRPARALEVEQFEMKPPDKMPPGPTQKKCPFCGKSVYSPSGIHPQCAVAKADAAQCAALKAKNETVERPPSRPPFSKACPKCKRSVPARRFRCECGHHFAQAKSVK